MLRLKMDSGKHFIPAAVSMYMMYLMFYGKRGIGDYLDSILMSLCDIINWSLPDATAAQQGMLNMLHENLSCFNEEAGEIAFSVLARLIQSNSRRNQHEQCAGQFKMLKANIATAKALGYDVDFQFGKGKEAGRTVVSDKDIATAKGFLQSMIRECVAGVYHPYHANFKKFNNAMDCKLGGEVSMPEVKSMERLFQDVKPAFDKHLSKIPDRMEGWWIAKEKKSWPDLDRMDPFEGLDMVDLDANDNADSGAGDDGDEKHDEDPDEDGMAFLYQYIRDHEQEENEQDIVHEEDLHDFDNDGGFWEGDVDDEGFDVDVKNRSVIDNPEKDDDSGDDKVGPPARVEKKKKKKKGRKNKKRKLAKEASSDQKQAPVVGDDGEDDLVGGVRRSGRKRKQQNWSEVDDRYEGFEDSADDDGGKNQ